MPLSLGLCQTHEVTQLDLAPMTQLDLAPVMQLDLAPVTQLDLAPVSSLPQTLLFYLTCPSLTFHFSPLYFADLRSREITHPCSLLALGEEQKSFLAVVACLGPSLIVIPHCGNITPPLISLSYLTGTATGHHRYDCLTQLLTAIPTCHTCRSPPLADISPPHFQSSPPP